MLNILTKIQSNPTTEDYQQLMLTFLQGIIEAVREEPDPLKADWKYHCIEEIVLNPHFSQILRSLSLKPLCSLSLTLI